MNVFVPNVRMNVDEFLAWSEKQRDDRFELVDGEIVAMTRDRVGHNRAKGAAYVALREAVRAAGLPCEVFVDGLAVAINSNTVRIPDVIVHCGPALESAALLTDSPVIVVEVVSPSSERDDIGTKFVDYFSVASIHHYVILLSERRAVVHHRRNERGVIESRVMKDGAIPLDPPGLSVSVASLLA